MLRFEDIEVMTFDCFGTLMDWESGIVAALQPVLEAHAVVQSEPEILQRYARLEPAAEAGRFRNYKAVLREVVDGFARELGFVASEEERNCLIRSFAQWQPFPDTVATLQALAPHYELVVLSNVDDDLFAATAVHLRVEFAKVFTAEQAGHYKPSLHFFEFALQKLAVPPRKILHVAQSLYHDIAPARELGLGTVWVNRRHGRAGPGATPPSDATPDLTVPDLRSLAARMGVL